MDKMLPTPLAAIRLAVAMANAEPRSVVAKWMRASKVRDAADIAIVENADPETWEQLSNSWASKARTWLTAAMRAKHGKRVQTDSAARRPLSLWQEKQAKSKQEWRKAHDPDEIVNEIVALLKEVNKGLRFSWQLDKRRLIVTLTQETSLAVAAYGALLLFDKRGGHISHLRICRNPKCGHFLFKVGDKGRPRERCPGECSRAGGRERKRRWDAGRKARRGRVS